jgi:iron complex outermembrane receptor protein
MPRLSKKMLLFVGTALVHLCGPTIAHAQVTTGQEAPAATPETIVVTGYRAANRAAVRAKQTADVVLDAISQDDIGRLPDLNIVESSRRIVGLSTVGGLDPTKNRDIFQRVAIRGLDPRYNLITVDGAPLASGEWTVRGARLEQFPNSLVSRIEAIKTLTAEYDPHGLGGQLNIVSRSAFSSSKDRFFAVNATVGENSTSGDFVAGKKPNVRADATASIKFGPNDAWGLTVSGEYQKLFSSAFSELPGDTAGNGWTYFTAAGVQTPFKNLSADGFMVAIRPQDFRFDNERTRSSINTKLEYKFSENNIVSLFAGYYEDEDIDFRAEMLTPPGGRPTNVTATSGTFATGNLQPGIVLQPQERKTALVTAKGNFELANRVKLDLIGSISNATYDERRIFHKWASTVTPGRVQSTNSANYGYNYTIVDGSPKITHLAPTLGTNPDSYVNLYVRDVYRDADSHVGFASAKLSYNMDQDDRGFGGRVGASFTQTIQKFGVEFEELTPKDLAAQTQVGGLGQFIYDKRFPSRSHSAVPYLVIDPQKVLAYVAQNRSLFVATDQRANNFGDDFRDQEDVNAVFVQGLYQTDRWIVQAGLRYDETNVEATTYQVPTTAGSTAYEKLTRTSSYDFVLPSALATYKISEDMRLVGGVSKTIGRPDFSQYAARTTYSIGTTPGFLTINTGNPDLKPREAVNYDLSYEWYRPRGGLLSVAVFKKEISNEIVSGTQAGPSTTYLGVTYPNVTINTSINAAKGEVQGLEISYNQDRFEFLPEWLSGVGLNANLTFLDGSFDLPVSAAGIANGQSAIRKTSSLIQQPEFISNATLFYSRGPFEARVSYNKVGRALQQANSDTPERDLFQEPRDQIDAQIRYELGEFDIVLQAQNITEEPFVVRQGPGRAYINNFFPVGTTVWLGFSWRPSR